MPRNNQGLYTLPLPPVRAGELVESQWANQTLDDLAQAMTGSLPRDGSAPMVGPLILSNDPISQPRQAVPKEYVDQFMAFSTGMFIGGMVYAALTTPPAGWLLCNGQAVSRSTYSDLFAAIGTTFGNGDGSTTFNLPNQQRRYLRGRGDGELLGGLLEQSFQQHNHSFDDPGHGHTAAQVAHSHTTNAHSHVVNDPGHAHTLSGGDDFAGLNWTLHQALNAVGPVGTGVSGTGITLQEAAPGTNSVQPQVSIGQSLTGASVGASGGTETRPASIVCNLFIKAQNDASGPSVITNITSSDPACISINNANPVVPQIVPHTNVGFGLVKLDQDAKIPVAQMPAGIQTFLGTFDASGGQNPSQKFPTTAFTDGMTYLLSSGGTISVFDPNTNVEAPTTVNIGWNLVYLHNSTQPEGWYYIESAVVTAATASSVAFVPSGNITATNVQAAIEELDAEKLSLTGGTVTGPTVIETSSSSPALRVTQTGSGNVVLFEDQTNPDNSPTIIDTNGRLLIGKLAAATIAGYASGVQVESSSVSFSSQWLSKLGNDSGGITFDQSKTRAVTYAGTGAPLLNGDNIGAWRCLGAGSDGVMVVASRIRTVVGGVVSDGSVPGIILFETTPVGGLAPVERFRIGGNGSFGINGNNPGANGQVLTSGGAGNPPAWGTPTAANITNVPAGNVAATTVQAAINELDTEKSPLIVSGTDGNGTYTKYPDGTLVMVRTFGNAIANNPNTAWDWTFPVELLAVDYSVVATFVSLNSGTIRATVEAITSSRASGFIFNSGSAQSGSLVVQCIGRWKP